MRRIKTYYEILDVDPEASTEDISFAYRRALERLAREGDEDNAARANIRIAYETLSHPLQRSAYNATNAEAINRLTYGDVGAESGGEGWLSVTWVRVALVVLVLLIGLGVWKTRRTAEQAAFQQVAAVKAAAKAAESAAPAEAESAATQPFPRTASLTIPRTPEELFALLNQSVVKVIVGDGSGNTISTGSGVVIGSGSIITNCHVVNKGSQITVKLGADSYGATISQSDEEFDLCKLYAGGVTARPVPIGTVDSLRVGQKVFAIGSPYGLENTLSEGLVSALREVRNGKVIQTSAPISPGSSGGGLFDVAGNLVGIMTFQHRFGQNLNFAVPADWISAMQSRSGSGPMGDSSSAGAPPPAAVEREQTPHEMIAGKWWCYGTVTGNNGSWTFSPGGKVIIERDGKLSSGNYQLNGRAIQIIDKGGALNWEVDELTPEKMVFNTGNGRRLVCEKR